MIRAAAGHLAIFLLNVLGRLPASVTIALGTMFLPVYIPFRVRTRERLSKLHPPVSAFAYYRMRLRLALLSVKHALKVPDGCETIVEGGDALRAALASGVPVVLLGWHQGPVELLHRIPAETSDRPLYLMTAAAFSPALSDWMTRGRESRGTTVIRPGDRTALRDWARSGCILAAMIDQVPGDAENWLSLRNDAIRIPWPTRLIEWLVSRKPVFLAVSTRWEQENRIVFRYDPLDANSLKPEIARLMEQALTRTPEQYNWSYGKLRLQGSLKANG